MRTPWSRRLCDMFMCYCSCVYLSSVFVFRIASLTSMQLFHISPSSLFRALKPFRFFLFLFFPDLRYTYLDDAGCESDLSAKPISVTPDTHIEAFFGSNNLINDRFISIITSDTCPCMTVSLSRQKNRQLRFFYFIRDSKKILYI